MFSRLFILLFTLFSSGALACDLDDCTLAVALHSADQTQAQAPEDSYSWMNHDLAVGRDSLSSGDRARALALVRDLDGLLRTHLTDIVRIRGEVRTRALHTALQNLARDAGGWSLAELDVPSKGAQG